MTLDDMARVRVVPPWPGGRRRLCDVEVSSDGGKTWAPLPTAMAGVVIEAPCDDMEIITVAILAIPDVVDIQIAEAKS